MDLNLGKYSSTLRLLQANNLNSIMTLMQVTFTGDIMWNGIICN